MRLLVLSFYYRPDLSAGSFRTTALIHALQTQLPEGSQIDLVTTLPNRYSSFASEAAEREDYPGLTVHRIALPGHKSGVLDQSKAFIAYAKSVLNLVRNSQYDLVYATSSRLMTASLGALVAGKVKAPLYLDIRDIFVDTIKDVFSKKLTWALKPAFSRLESWTIGSATKVNLVSAGFLSYFQERYPQQRYSLFTNGIDEDFIQAQPTSVTVSQKDVLDVVYAGNMGEGQGLHAIIPGLAKHFEGRLRFRLIGDGGRKPQLLNAVKEAGCTNVEILPPVARDQLISIYNRADVLFLHLNDYPAFRKVLPSKLFEYAALGKPIWAGVAGHAADFIKANISNAAVFDPCNEQQGIAAFDSLAHETRPRAHFVQEFARSQIMHRMAADIIAAGEGA